MPGRSGIVRVVPCQSPEPCLRQIVVIATGGIVGVERNVPVVVDGVLQCAQTRRFELRCRGERGRYGWRWGIGNGWRWRDRCGWSVLRWWWSNIVIPHSWGPGTGINGTVKIAAVVSRVMNRNERCYRCRGIIGILVCWDRDEESKISLTRSCESSESIYSPVVIFQDSES